MCQLLPFERVGLAVVRRWCATAPFLLQTGWCCAGVTGWCSSGSSSSFKIHTRRPQFSPDADGLPNSQPQGFWAKFQHVLTGPSSPSQKHWNDAKAAGSNAYDHAGNVHTTSLSLAQNLLLSRASIRYNGS